MIRKLDGIIMTDFDNPWKESLELFLPWFPQFFFSDIHRDIDWSRGYESLDKELQQIVREAELGPRLADKLWLIDGQELWVLVKCEWQVRVASAGDECGWRVWMLVAYADGHFPLALSTCTFRLTG
jgi:hypothetical protein